jgi:hypothetical protein
MKLHNWANGRCTRCRKLYVYPDESRCTSEDDAPSDQTIEALAADLSSAEQVLHLARVSHAQIAEKVARLEHRVTTLQEQIAARRAHLPGGALEN